MIHKLILILLLTAVNTFAFAGQKNNLGNECLPSGILAISKEKINPIGFWQFQVTAINNDMQNYMEQRRLENLIQRQEREKYALEQKQYRETLALFGDKPMEFVQDPEVERELAKIRADQSNGYVYQMQWYKKCLAYSKIKAGIK